MAIIYYPSGSLTYTRQVSGGQMIEHHISVASNQIIVLSGSVPATASTDFISASFAVSASFAANAGSGGGGGSSDYIGNQVFS